MKTKQFNFYNQEDQNIYIEKVDFAVDRTATGAITVDYLTSSAPLLMIQEGQATNAITGTGVLETAPYQPIPPATEFPYPMEQYQDLLWHPLYFQSVGTSLQLFFYFSEEQMINPNISLSAFELEGFVVYCMRSGRKQ